MFRYDNYSPQRLVDYTTNNLYYRSNFDAILYVKLDYMYVCIHLVYIHIILGLVSYNQIKYKTSECHRYDVSRMLDCSVHWNVFIYDFFLNEILLLINFKKR